jgi:hypothetical protein
VQRWRHPGGPGAENYFGAQRAPAHESILFVTRRRRRQRGWRASARAALRGPPCPAAKYARYLPSFPCTDGARGLGMPFPRHGQALKSCVHAFLRCRRAKLALPRRSKLLWRPTGAAHWAEDPGSPELSEGGSLYAPALGQLSFGHEKKKRRSAIHSATGVPLCAFWSTTWVCP